MKYEEFKNMLELNGYIIRVIGGVHYVEKDNRALRIDPLLDIEYDDFESQFRNQAETIDNSIFHDNFISSNNDPFNFSHDQDLFPNSRINKRIGEYTGGMFIGGNHDLFQGERIIRKNDEKIKVPPMAKFDLIEPDTDDPFGRKSKNKGKKKSGEPDPDHLRKFQGDSDDEANFI